MAAFKSWFQPSLTLAAAVERSFDTGLTRTGLTLQVGARARFGEGGGLRWPVLRSLARPTANAANRPIRQPTNETRCQVENFGRLRYERSREALAHGRILTQRHEATEAELAMSEGDRPLVRAVSLPRARAGCRAPPACRHSRRAAGPTRAAAAPQPGRPARGGRGLQRARGRERHLPVMTLVGVKERAVLRRRGGSFGGRKPRLGASCQARPAARRGPTQRMRTQRGARGARV